jgi:hypothetical protein
MVWLRVIGVTSDTAVKCGIVYDGIVRVIDMGFLTLDHRFLILQFLSHLFSYQLSFIFT